MKNVLEKLWSQTAFVNLAKTKKRKDAQAMQLEIEVGQSLQQQIITALKSLDETKLYKSRTEFASDLDKTQ